MWTDTHISHEIAATKRNQQPSNGTWSDTNAVMKGWVFNTGDNDPKSTGLEITIIAIVLTTLSFLCLSLRLYVRFFMVKATGAGQYRRILPLLLTIGGNLTNTIQYTDDWLAIISWVNYPFFPFSAVKY